VHVPVLQAALLAGSLAASPASAPPAVPVFSSETSLVNVSVTVEDRDGQPIPGLSAQDFALSEDGKRRQIVLCARMGEAGGRPSTALDVALLVDTSDSMLDTLRRSQDSAVRFLSGLPDAQELLVVLFDQTQRVEHFDREHPEALFESLKTVPAGGNTALRDAITFTLRTLASSTGRSALVLLTDGVDTVSTTSPEALVKAVESHAVVIYPVAFPTADVAEASAREAALKTLGRLAELSGGRLFRLPNEQALPGVLDEILADLRAQYVLGFAPDSEGPRDRLRRISVKVPGHGKAIIRHRVGYRLAR
jgi:Ca-activated chloride channel family protein